MKLCYWGKDGGEESRVWGFWLIEWKRYFSIALLKFEHGSREAYHNHAFNAVSWLLTGALVELDRAVPGTARLYSPSWRPIFTPREMFHQVQSVGRSWVLTFRGPWRDEWDEYRPTEMRMVRLTHGRKEVSSHADSER